MSTLGLSALAIGCMAFLFINTSHNAGSIRHLFLNSVFNQSSRELQTALPKIVWLMSFPEAGATNLMHLVHTLSEKSTATNYGRAMMDLEGNIMLVEGDSVPVYEDQPGPALYSNLRSPKHHILTRTHSTGYCFDCPPSEYLGSTVQKRHMYWNFYANIVTDNEAKIVKYDSELVGRMLILVRDPMDHVAARFYQKRQKEIDRGNTEYGDKYTPDAEGFHKYCEDMDNGAFLEEELSWYGRYGYLEEAQVVPCRSEFVKIFAFYNNARLVGLKYKLYMETISSKDLAMNLDETMNKVLGFLDLDRVNEMTPTNVLGDGEGLFSHFYTDQQRVHVAKLCKTACLPYVWDKYLPYLEKYLLPAQYLYM